MEKRRLKLIEKEDLYFAGKMWRLKLEAPDIDAEPGQFVNIAVDGQYLRRPISVSDYKDGILELVVSPVGEGTRKIVDAPIGHEFDMLTGLGNKFTLEPPVRNIVLFGGGVGYAPLVGLLHRLKERKYNVKAFFGFNTERDVPLRHISRLMDEYGIQDVVMSTMTGEMGEKGNPLEVASMHYKLFHFQPEYFYACGPMPMLKAVYRSCDFPGEVSLEARMGCGFGACMGCTIETADGPRRICKEGPVFSSKILNF